MSRRLQRKTRENSINVIKFYTKKRGKHEKLHKKKQQKYTLENNPKISSFTHKAHFHIIYGTPFLAFRYTF